MARRTPKPFTVEVHKGGRRVKAAAAPLWPADPMLADDQPRMSWPGLESVPEQPVETQEQAVTPPPVTGRVLPALDEPRPSMEEPKRRGRGPAKPKAAATADLPAEVEAPTPVEIEAEHAPYAPAVEEPDDALVIVSGATARANTVLFRRSRRRALRSDFKRGEKWKARLPIAALRSRR